MENINTITSRKSTLVDIILMPEYTFLKGAGPSHSLKMTKAMNKAEKPAQTWGLSLRMKQSQLSQQGAPAAQLTCELAKYFRHLSLNFFQEKMGKEYNNCVHLFSAWNLNVKIFRDASTRINIDLSFIHFISYWLLCFDHLKLLKCNITLTHFSKPSSWYY